MARAAERTAPAILSAGAIVVVAMLTLALADFNATREMGPILALGVAIMVLAGLTLLPAVLTVLGRRAFWPAVPRRGCRAARAAAGRGPRSRASCAAGPAADGGGGDGGARRGGARRAGRARAALVRRLVPRPAAVRAGAGRDRRALHPGAGGAGRRGHGLRRGLGRGRRAVRGPARADRGDVPERALGPGAGPRGPRPLGGLPLARPVLAGRDGQRAGDPRRRARRGRAAARSWSAARSPRPTTRSRRWRATRG